jgi:hypothetical protein
MKTKRFWLLPALLAVLAGCPADDGEGSGEGAGERIGGQLAVERVGAAAGSTVSYEVRVDGGPSEITAFGLDVTYDPAALSYVGWEKGGLTQGFTQVGANGIAEDTVRIGGFTVDGAVPAGATGSLAALQFEVVGTAPSELSIRESMDDLKAFSTSAQ